MKKFLVWLLAFVMVFALVGCGAPAQTEPTPGSGATQPPSDATPAPDNGDKPADYSDFKVAALLAGVITDNGWNASAYGAIMNLKEKYGVEANYVESIAVSDMEENMRIFADQGYNLVICHGSQYIDIVNGVASEYPETFFAISYGDEDVSKHPNVVCVGPVNTGVLVGIVAGALTENNKVAFLGGEENPSISFIVDRFEDGVRMVNKDAEVQTGYIGSLTDADKAKEMSMSLIDKGFDVISASANAAGLGVIQAAVDGKIKAVGFNSDQYTAGPEAVVVSVMRNFNQMYENLFNEIVNGTCKGGLYAYGIKEQGAILSDWHGWDAKLPPEKVALINDTIQKIIDGEISEY